MGHRVAAAEGKGIAEDIMDHVRLLFRNHKTQVTSWIWNRVLIVGGKTWVQI
jgi:hypothetical protein